MDTGYLYDTIYRGQAVIRALRLSKALIASSDLGFSGYLYRLAVFALAVNEMLPAREQGKLPIKESIAEAYREIMVEKYTIDEMDALYLVRNGDCYRIHYLYDMVAPAIRRCAYWNIGHISPDALNHAEEMVQKILNRIMREQQDD